MALPYNKSKFNIYANHVCNNFRVTMGIWLCILNGLAFYEDTLLVLFTGVCRSTVATYACSSQGYPVQPMY
jgi:hypothetical protein